MELSFKGRKQRIKDQKRGLAGTDQKSSSFRMSCKVAANLNTKIICRQLCPPLVAYQAAQVPYLVRQVPVHRKLNFQMA